jgi:hypothetical protein
MFTDIQGSTALWERYGDGFHDMLGMHHAVLRNQIAKLQAYEVKTEGDAFMITFSSAASAVHFALQTQRALHQAEWPAQLIEDSLPIGSGTNHPRWQLSWAAGADGSAHWSAHMLTGPNDGTNGLLGANGQQGWPIDAGRTWGTNSLECPRHGAGEE